MEAEAAGAEGEQAEGVHTASMPPVAAAGQAAGSHLHRDELADPRQPLAHQVGGRRSGHVQHVPGGPREQAVAHAKKRRTR